MSARSELSQARKAVARGRGDEALVILWNLVERARLENDGKTFRAIGELAADIARTDEGSRREAERLLESLGVQPVASNARPEPTEPAVATSEETQVDGESTLEDWLPEEGELPAAGDLERAGFDPAPTDQDEVEAEHRPRSRTRFVIPVVVGLAILINLLARALGDS